jgi:hypothetical protein
MLAVVSANMDPINLYTPLRGLLCKPCGYGRVISYLFDRRFNIAIDSCGTNVFYKRVRTPPTLRTSTIMYLNNVIL